MRETQKDFLIVQLKDNELRINRISDDQYDARKNIALINDTLIELLKSL